MFKECCIGSYLTAKEAYVKGVVRMDLCDNLAEGSIGIDSLFILDD